MEHDCENFKLIVALFAGGIVVSITIYFWLIGWFKKAFK